MEVLPSFLRSYCSLMRGDSHPIFDFFLAIYGDWRELERSFSCAKSVDGSSNFCSTAVLEQGPFEPLTLPRVATFQHRAQREWEYRPPFNGRRPDEDVVPENQAVSVLASSCT
eukprot:scaffold1715_cov334-Pavlova_lutheri.AAC.5